MPEERDAMDSAEVNGRESVVNRRKQSVLEKPLDLDDVLVNELGQLGWFQIRIILLVVIPIMMAAFMSEYIFSAAAIPHRCWIPECNETSKEHKYDPEWILNAVPQTSSGFSSCQRFAFRTLGAYGTLDSCPAVLFDQTKIEECQGYVYEKSNSVVFDFDLGCRDWLRAFAGTLNSIGILLAMPITGYMSDRFGRRFALVVNVFNLSLIGLIKAFSVNYTMYMILQIVQTTLGAGTFSSAYIFAAELVGPKYRVLTSATLSSIFAIGQVILGAVAWLIQPWRYMLMALHIPGFIIIAYYGILSESIRWLISKRRFEEAKKVLQTVARVNGTQISEKSLQALMRSSESPPPKLNDGSPSLVHSIVRSPILLRRVCTTPVWWITTIFVYYGLSIDSTSLSDTIYLNYILTCAIEIPGFYTAVFVLDRYGRKATISSGFFFSAACNIIFVFIPSNLSVFRLIIFLLGKFGISMVMTSLYLYTSELYPTEFRHSLLAFSSMIGRIGSITAPLTPVLMNYWHGIPSMLFGGMGILSGLLVLTQPETLGTKMPDTLAEAEALGNPESKLQHPS
ncbi:organic cation transporter protein-like isoform X2 [Maniola hyperantus]|uniref:organic cation transporter protein-like isoform X2 n=1 Tax=Aphantopus hyperantus TaxID=2795564 RepID=UPI001568E5D8|nr:organic cation transporter protein-like [Maniola hyperantus]